MTLNELSTKNDTSHAVCYILANRERHRNEPLKLVRFAAQVREFMARFKMGDYNTGDFNKTIDVLVELKWGRILNSKSSNKPQWLEFIKPLSTFGKALELTGGSIETTHEELVAAPVEEAPPVKGLTTSLTFILQHGKVVMEISGGELKTVIRELKEII